MKLFTYAGVTVEVTDEQENQFQELIKRIKFLRNTTSNMAAIELIARELQLKCWVDFDWTK
jgi:hypothetical protein